MRLFPALASLIATVVVGVPAALAADRTIDDRNLAKKGSWSSVSHRKAYGKTLLRATKRGAMLTTTVAATSGGAVIFQAGKGRGTATISVGGKRGRTVSTAARKTAFKRVAFSGAGPVRITVTRGGRGVYVDAVVFTGGSPTPGGGSPTPGGPPTPGGSPTPGGTPGGSGPAPVALGPLAQVDTSATGTGGNGDDVTDLAVSPNGQLIAFWSAATNLVPGVADARRHLYVKTIASGAIRVLDAAQDGTLSNDNGSALGAHGLAWKPDSNEILFTSSATNLGPDVSTLTAPYLYAKELDDNSVGVLAEKATIDMAWSPDGKKIVYGSTGDYCFPMQSPCTNTATSDTKLYVLDLTTFNHIPVSATQAGVQPTYYGGPNDSVHPVWSPDSKKVAFEYGGPHLSASDTNVRSDIYVKDITTLAIARISEGPGGVQGNGSSEWPAWSPDGTRLAFDSGADNFVAGDNNSGNDVFVKDLGSGAISAVSAEPSGEFKLFDHRIPRWSPDGTRIAFNSKSVDLIPGYVDVNQREDIYVRDLAAGTFQLISARPDGVIGNADSTLWNVTGNSGGWLPDGHGIAFLSRSTNFSNDNNAFSESVFLKTGL